MYNVFLRSSFSLFFSSSSQIDCDWNRWSVRVFEGRMQQDIANFENSFNTIIYYFIIMYTRSTKDTRLTLINEFRLTSIRSLSLVLASIFNRPLSNSIFGMTGKTKSSAHSLSSWFTIWLVIDSVVSSFVCVFQMEILTQFPYHHNDGTVIKINSLNLHKNTSFTWMLSTCNTLKLYVANKQTSKPGVGWQLEKFAMHDSH